MVVMISKLGKLRTDPMSYSPIALFNIMEKIFERILTNGPLEFLDNNLPSDHQLETHPNAANPLPIQSSDKVW